MGEDDDDDDDDTVLLFLAFTGAPGRYTRQLLLSCPLVQISFLIFILDVLFFLPRHPTSHLLMALLIIFHLIFKTHQMRR
jgi:hypothetical protein